MTNLNFDEGYKTYTINGDPDRVIKVATSDYSIVNRLEEAYTNIEEKMKEYNNINTADMKTDEAAAAIKDLTEFIEAQINFIFNSDIAGIVFNGQSCLSLINGVPLYERFINAIAPKIEKDYEAAAKASEKRISKYTTGAGANAYKKSVRGK